LFPALELVSVRPQFWFRQIRGGGRDTRSRSWCRRCVFISRRRIILLQRWHSVVRPPSTSSWGVRPERRTSGSCRSGSESPCCGTRRWQNWQRISLPGQEVVRCWARLGRPSNWAGQSGQECGLWYIESWVCLLVVSLPWEESWGQCQWFSHSGDRFWKTLPHCEQRMLLRRQKFSWRTSVRSGTHC
jgi:hypothetical protein